MAEELMKDPFALFEESAMSFEEAQDKVKSESRVKTNYFRFDKDGEYRFRVLPIAPTLVDGQYIIDRPGYEYPLIDYMLMFPNEGGKKPRYVSVIDPTQVFPNIKGDLIKTYLDLATKESEGDQKTIEALGNIANKGGAGLKPSFRRCIYVINQDDPGKIAMLQLSNSQYRDLETLKMSTWKELRKDDPKAPCPLTHFKHGYDVIANKVSSPKTSITFSLSRREVPIDEKILKELLDMDRIPNVIYRYERFHLEATVEYLKLVDEKFGFDFMDLAESGEFKNDDINTVYQQIKMSLPADDHSHFSMVQSDNDDDDPSESGKTLSELEEMVEKYADADKDSDEFKSVKNALQDYIEIHELDFQIRRYMDLEQILDGIKDASKADPDDEQENDEPSDQNDDTAEPAHRPARQRRQ